MSDIKDNSSAFPSSFMPESIGDCTGMTLRQYAAIKLKVPDSGADWLDEMISKSLRDDMAGKVMPALISESSQLSKKELKGHTVAEAVAITAYAYSDAMLEARK